ncbi:hypothetical protein [Amycolatopsis panacis]|nr:hypothetical protein [Amycolatopsis panacis]
MTSSIRSRSTAGGSGDKCPDSSAGTAPSRIAAHASRSQSL